VGLLALVLHLPVAWLLTIHAHGYDPDARSWLVVAQPVALESQAPAPAMVYRGNRRNRPSVPAPVAVPAGTLAPSTPQVVARSPEVLTFAPISVPEAQVTDTVAIPPAGPSRLAPHFNGGLVWTAPLPMTPQEMANRLTGKTHIELVDSAVTAIIQQYLDQMAEERAHLGPALPAWTTTIGGKTVGIDQKWIYLGPIKVPTALLALLPINLQGNPTQAEFNRKLNVMREDLFDAARRAANYEEFKRAVKDLHDETERQREFKRNRAIRPDSGRGG